MVEKTDSGIEEGKIEGVELIELKNISKQYCKETTILKDIDLCIEDGDYIALMGPSGGENNINEYYGLFGSCNTRRIFP